MTGMAGTASSSRDSSIRLAATWPETASGQLADLTEGLRRVLGDGLVGVYLHGSLAMGCFNPARSDLDLLVVIEASMEADTKSAVMAHLLAVSGRPHAIEISIL